MLPVSNRLVDHFMEAAEWGEAILECLATFSAEQTPLPADSRAMVQAYLADDRPHPRLKRYVQYALDRVPV
ncbi:hypothetical protein ABIA30_003116 [Mycobacterium sp. MAA66]|uniref:hypothetical protein n=1 Tax=Mycobacterium sp. MAA66 TaxID=3156297 RepID=UPI003513E6AD